MNCCKRAFFSLVEVIIAMSLTMALLGILLGSYVQIERLNVALEKEQDHSFRKLYLSTRLAAIIPKTVASNDTHKDYIFYSSLANDGTAKSGTSVLTFTFDNGPQLDPAFSNHVLGRLYLNQKNQLCLSMWPSPARWVNIERPPMKSEVLLEGVTDFSLQYYAPPKKNRQLILSNNATAFKESDLLKLDTLGEWRNEWLQEYGDLPVLVKMKITSAAQGGESFTLAYPLPKSHLIIVYE